MFEHVKRDVVSLEIFLHRLFRYFCIATAMLLFGLIPGFVGFSLIGNLIPIEALINSISLLGGLEPPYELDFYSGRVFIAIYSLFIETVFFLAIAMMLAPVAHRVLHKMHIQTQ